MTDFPRYVYAASLVRVIDGDTIEVDIDLGFFTHVTTRLRLLGVDTPELIGPDRARALIVKSVLTGMLSNRPLKLRTVKSDKYGRFLADVWVEHETDVTHVNQWLIDSGYGIAYVGGPK